MPDKIELIQYIFGTILNSYRNNWRHNNYCCNRTKQCVVNDVKRERWNNFINLPVFKQDATPADHIDRNSVADHIFENVEVTFAVLVTGGDPDGQVCIPDDDVRIRSDCDATLNHLTHTDIRSLTGARSSLVWFQKLQWRTVNISDSVVWQLSVSVRWLYNIKWRSVSRLAAGGWLYNN